MSQVEKRLDDLYNAVLDGSAPAARTLVEQLIADNVDASSDPVRWHDPGNGRSRSPL